MKERCSYPMVRTTSRTESGARITVTVEADEEEHESPGWIEEEDEDGCERQLNVLHVDDSDEFVEMAAIYLQRGNDHLNIETETNPVEALERLGDEEFDCVISDCSMPDMEMNGMEMYEEVRSEHPNLSFVFFTGTPISEFPDEIKNHEETGHMQKEIDTTQFSNLAHWITETVE